MTDGLPDVHHFSVQRSARYALLGKPGPEIRELWIVLHGYRQLAPRFIRRFRGIAEPHRLIAAPEALNRFYVGAAPGRHGPEARVGGTWMTSEDREAEITDYIRYLDGFHAHLAQSLHKDCRTVVLGFSQGVHTAARWTALGQTSPDTVIFWGEYLPTDLDRPAAVQAWRGSQLLFVRGEADEHHRPERASTEIGELVSMGAQTSERTHGQGHRINEGLVETLAAELTEGWPSSG